MNVFIYNSYKEFFRGFISENKQKGLISKIAAQCGCDRTYFSQVLNGKADLTPDHLVQFSENIGFKEEEVRYLMLLLLHDRSSSLAAKKSFKKQIESLKKKNLALSNKILNKEKPLEITEEMRTLYYSSWLYGAVHILTSIPAYQTVQALSEKLNISITMALRLLRDLQEMQLVKKEKDGYSHQGGDIYLPRHSIMSHAHHLNWRMRAVERSMMIEDVHYTTTFSISQEDADKLRNQVLQLIEEQRKQVQASGTDVAYVFCCDFFEV